MRYLGGKYQISKSLGECLNKIRGDRFFIDPFCGSLAMSCALGGNGHASDIHPALISMYKAIQAGWEIPEEVSKSEWQEAKNLPDSDPMKAFCGFACSFRGLYFSGYAGGYVGPASDTGARGAKKALLRDFERLSKHKIEISNRSFFDIPINPDFFVYLDPPYRDTTTYQHKLDYESFYSRIKEWTVAGAVVCVSEYFLPFGQIIWSRDRKSKLSLGTTKNEKCYMVTKESISV